MDQRMAIVVFVGVVGCAGAGRAPDPAAGAFAAELGRCVQRAATLAASAACRAEVEKRYAPLMPDGGAK